MDIKQNIKSILKQMDVNLDREDAESKAFKIYSLGPEALDILILLAHKSLDSGLDEQAPRKYIRAIIFTVVIFAQKNKKSFKESDEYDRAVELLYKLSVKGFQSASSALNRLHVSIAEINKKILISLPLSEKHSHDKVVSLSEALEEIKISSSLSGTKGIASDHYKLGQVEKHRFEIYRIGKKLFGVRTRKKKSAKS